MPFKHGDKVIVRSVNGGPMVLGEIDRVCTQTGSRVMYWIDTEALGRVLRAEEAIFEPLEESS